MKPIVRRPTAIDIFSGVGGLCLGFEQAGFDVLAALEINPIDAKAHQFNFPYCPTICEDIRRIKGEALLSKAKAAKEALGEPGWDGRVDVVFGGPPCQGFSLGGHRDLEDDRNALIFEFARIVKEIQPRYFVMENVPGLLTARFAGVVAQVKNEFRKSGYARIDTYVLNASDYGVPQDRARVFFIGRKNGTKGVATPRRCSPVVIADAFPASAATAVPLRGQTQAAMTKNSRYLSQLMAFSHALAYKRSAARTVLRDQALTNHSDDVIKRFSSVPPGTADIVSRFLRLEWGGVACTLRAGTGRDRGSHTAPRPIHPTLPRVITVREAARIHSFPDWFGFTSAKWHAWRQIGNSVPPALGKAVAKSVSKALGISPPRPRTVVRLGDETLLSVSARGQKSASRKTG